MAKNKTFKISDKGTPSEIVLEGASGIMWLEDKKGNKYGPFWYHKGKNDKITIT